ncbi:MAG: hypothetical protein JSR98_20530 [Proteobacteria bacterium]|nr:hypothetical protein [Pseudomonadota bacterium]
MDRRTMLGLLAAGTALPVHAGERRAARKPAAPGDLTGLWTNAWYTHLQRPKAFKTLVVTPAEAQAYETPRHALHGEIVAPDDVLGQNAAEFPDNGPGLARIDGQIRTSWIVDPADGRIPYRTDAPKGVHAPLDSGDYDNPEARDTDEQCLTDPGAGAPILNDHDANLVQFVLTGDARTGGQLAIVGEKNHQVRIVDIPPAGAAAPRHEGAPDWMGASVGRWEGATLVVTTTNLRPGLTKMGGGLYLSEHARVTERFTRTGPASIAYRFEVEDESLFTQVWKAEMVFRPAEGRLFEYACHEGNYGLPNILSAARRLEAEGASAKGK